MLNAVMSLHQVLRFVDPSIRCDDVSRLDLVAPTVWLAGSVLWWSGYAPAVVKNSENSPAGVVFHLDEADPDKHASVLRNVRNLLDELADESPIELVVHGPGLAAALRDAPHADQVRELLSRGFTVAACSNTMKAMSVSVDQLLDGVYVVPAGIAQLVRRQREGWAYVRP